MTSLYYLWWCSTLIDKKINLKEIRFEVFRGPPCFAHGDVGGYFLSLLGGGAGGNEKVCWYFICLDCERCPIVSQVDGRNLKESQMSLIVTPRTGNGHRPWGWLWVSVWPSSLVCEWGPQGLVWAWGVAFGPWCCPRIPCWTWLTCFFLNCVRGHEGEVSCMFWWWRRWCQSEKKMQNHMGFQRVWQCMQSKCRLHGYCSLDCWFCC